MTIEVFQHDVFTFAFRSPICGIPIVRRITSTSVNFRIPLTIGNFVDIFYNEETGTTAFALIEKGKRIFGADNTGGWHLHPFENPDHPIKLEKPLNAEEFFDMIQRHFQKT
jgi:Ethanolamine utilization protein EutJ (predicted chaperonin)